ncbi:MAG: hypothetical protein IPP94_19065 [Ignavibacteria bacterium]|nr:hypothetical protein [Ignavibacteria bacterium]
MATHTAKSPPGKKKKGSVTPLSAGGIFAAGAGLAFGGLLLLRLAAWRFPAERLWGFNHFAFLPDAAVAAFAALGLLACTPVVARVLARVPANTGDADRRPFALPLLLVLVSGLLFWFLRMQTYFLGDGAVYLAEIYRYVRGIPGSESVLYSKGSAPVTGWLFAQLARAAYGAAASGESLLANPQFAFWTLGAAAGMVFVYLSWKTAVEFGRDRMERVAIFTLAVCSPGVIFFFGYVEYYTFSFVALGAHLFFCLRTLEGRGGVAWAALTLLVATSFHFLAAVAYPGFALLLLWRYGNERLRAFVRPGPVLAAIAAILVASGVYYFASGIATQGSRVVLSLAPFGKEGAMQSYTLLSSYHLFDVVNYFVLLAGPLALALIFVLRKDAFRSAAVVVMLVEVLFFSFLAFFGNLGFGMARDWDINAVLGLAVLFFLLAVLRQSAPSFRTGSVLILAAGAALVGGGSWFWVNLSPQASVARYKAILALDDTHMMGDYALNGYEHLRKYAFAQNDAAGVIWAIRKKIECVGYPADYRKLALTVIQDAAPETKRAEYDWIFDRLFARIGAMHAAGRDSSYAGSKREYVELAAEAVLQCRYLPPRLGFDERYAAAQQARLEALAPGDPIVALARAQLEWIRTGAVADPAPFRAGADAVRESSTLAAYAGIALGTLKDYDRAVVALRKAVAIDSTFTLPLLYLAEAELRLDPPDRADALRNLDRFLANTAGSRVFGSRAQQEQLVRQAESMRAALRGNGDPATR